LDINIKKRREQKGLPLRLVRGETLGIGSAFIENSNEKKFGFIS